MSQNQKIILIVVIVLFLCCCCGAIASYSLSAGLEGLDWNEILSELEAQQ